MCALEDVLQEADFETTTIESIRLLIKIFKQKSEVEVDSLHLRETIQGLKLPVHITDVTACITTFRSDVFDRVNTACLGNFKSERNCTKRWFVLEQLQPPALKSAKKIILMDNPAIEYDVSFFDTRLRLAACPCQAFEQPVRYGDCQRTESKKLRWLKGEGVMRR